MRETCGACNIMNTEWQNECVRPAQPSNRSLVVERLSTNTHTHTHTQCYIEMPHTNRIIQVSLCVRERESIVNFAVLVQGILEFEIEAYQAPLIRERERERDEREIEWKQQRHADNNLWVRGAQRLCLPIASWHRLVELLRQTARWERERLVVETNAL